MYIATNPNANNTDTLYLVVIDGVGRPLNGSTGSVDYTPTPGEREVYAVMGNAIGACSVYRFNVNDIPDGRYVVQMWRQVGATAGASDDELLDSRAVYLVRGSEETVATLTDETINMLLGHGYIAPSASITPTATQIGKPKITVIRGETVPWQFLLYDGILPMQLTVGTHVWAGISRSLSGQDLYTWDSEVATGDGASISLDFVGSSVAPARVVVTPSAAQSLGLTPANWTLTVWAERDGARQVVVRNATIRVVEGAGEITDN